MRHITKYEKAGVFTGSSYDFDMFKQGYSQTTPMILICLSRGIHRLLRRYRATSPNLGEELSYIADTNAIILRISTLTYY